MKVGIVAVAAVAAIGVLGGAALAKKSAKQAPTPGPAGVIELRAGFAFNVLVTSCDDEVRSTESGRMFPMPEDFDNNQVVRGRKGRIRLVNNHELTEPRPGEFQGDKGKCAVPEQVAGDDDVDGFGAVSRLTLDKSGLRVLKRELITTGLHDLCAGTLTPWKTFLTNEEFPFGPSDPEHRSGWVWEINPRTGKAMRATGMGRFSHEQEARVGNAWILTNDLGNAQYLFKFVPDRARDLSSGKLYALLFDRTTQTGHWEGPLDPIAPGNYLDGRSLPAPTFANTFEKAEGIVRAPSGNGVVFSESGRSDAGRVWMLTGLDQEVVRGTVLAEGDWMNFSRPDNLLYTRWGDLLIFEDNGSSLADPRTGGLNDLWVLPKGKSGTANLVRLARILGGGEGTGPAMSANGGILYLSIQDQKLAGKTGQSRVIAIRGDFKRPRMLQR